MKTILYYFTGTGNSLAVARAIADRLPDTELIPIPMLLLDGEKIRAQKDANIGIISLLYTMGLPGIVVRFFDILDLSDAGYVFSVVTEGGTYGSPTSQIASLAKQSGHDLNAAWWIRMPDNYIPLSAPPAKPEQKTIREDALRKVAVLTEAVRERSLRQIDLITTGKLLRLVMYKPFMKNIPTFGKKNSSSAQTATAACSASTSAPSTTSGYFPKAKKNGSTTAKAVLPAPSSARLKPSPAAAKPMNGPDLTTPTEPSPTCGPRKAHPAANTKNNPLFFSRPARQA